MKIMKSPNDFFRKVLDTIKYDFGDLMVSNIFWVLMLLPILTIPAAFAGLYYSTSRLVWNERITKKLFFVGFKKYSKASYICFFSNIIVIGLLLFNIDYSVQFPQIDWLRYLRGVYWVLLGIWSLLQIYVFPLLIHQEKPRLFLALRNSALLWFKHITFSLLLSGIVILLVIASVYFYPLGFVISGGLIAFLSNLGLVYLLSKEQKPDSDDRHDPRD